MIKIIAVKKSLGNKKQKNTIIYVDDLAEFARILLTTTKITFDIN